MGRQRRPECIERHGDTYLVRRIVRVEGEKSLAELNWPPKGKEE
jgi:hypothetical protein